MNGLPALLRARFHLSAALALVDEVDEALLGAKISECLVLVDQQVGGEALAAPLANAESHSDL